MPFSGGRCRTSPCKTPDNCVYYPPYGHGSSTVSSFSVFSVPSFFPCGVPTYFFLLSDICPDFSIFMTCLDETSQMARLYEFFDLFFQGPTIFRSVPKIAMVPTMLGLIRTLRGGGSAQCSKMIDIECFFHDS